MVFVKYIFFVSLVFGLTCSKIINVRINGGNIIDTKNIVNTLNGISISNSINSTNSINSSNSFISPNSVNISNIITFKDIVESDFDLKNANSKCLRQFQEFKSKLVKEEWALKSKYYYFFKFTYNK